MGLTPAASAVAEPGYSHDALDHIAGHLTQPQRRLLVGSLVKTGPQDTVILVDGNQSVIQALQDQVSPLVDQEGARRFLTPLGAAVARRLNETGAFEIPLQRSPARRPGGARHLLTNGTDQ